MDSGVLVRALAPGIYGSDVLATPALGPDEQTTWQGDRGPARPQRRGFTTTTTALTGVPHLTGVWRATIRTLGPSDLYVIDNKFAANGGTSGWHSHPGPSLVFVVAGTMTNYTTDDTTACRTCTQPDRFTDPGGHNSHILHNEDHNVGGDDRRPVPPSGRGAADRRAGSRRLSRLIDRATEGGRPTRPPSLSRSFGREERGLLAGR